MSHVSDYFKQRRMEKRLRQVDVARMVGYRNLSKGCRRINTFEQMGIVRTDLLTRLAAALGIDQKTLSQKVAEDLADWQRWVSEPVEPFLVGLGFMCGPIELPDEIRSLSAAMKYTASCARRWKSEMGLVVSRRLWIWFDVDGALKQILEAFPPRLDECQVINPKERTWRPVEGSIAIQEFKWFRESFPKDEAHHDDV